MDILAYYSTQWTSPSVAPTNQPKKNHWSSILESKPGFPSHQQPILPGALGCYDQSLSGVCASHAQLAHRSGINGFLAEAYVGANGNWSQQQLEEIANSSESGDFKCGIAWRSISAPNSHETPPHITNEDIESLSNLLSNIASLDGYLRFDNRPVLAIHPQLAKNLPPAETIREILNTSLGNRFGSQLHIVGLDFEGQTSKQQDPPLNYDQFTQTLPVKNLPGTAAPKLGNAPQVRRIDYSQALAVATRNFVANPKTIPVVLPCYDSTPLRNAPRLFSNDYPIVFQDWLRSTIGFAKQECPAILLYAWNAWEEGAVLEPDSIRGDQRLLQISLAQEGDHETSAALAELESGSVIMPGRALQIGQHLRKLIESQRERLSSFKSAE